MSDLIKREDAIEAVRKSMQVLIDDDMTIKEILTEIAANTKEVAIDRLEALPSVDAVTMNNIQQLEAENGALKEMIKFYRNELDNALSADAVHGEWIRKEKEYNDCDGHYAYYWYECSVCGARPPKNQWKNEWHSNYCPSCGARMKGGAE